MRYEPVKFWVFRKGGTQVVLFEHHLPEEVRLDVINAFRKQGFSAQERIGRPD